MSSHQGRVISYDVVSGTIPYFAVVFPFHSGCEENKGEVTLIVEYAQGIHDMAIGLPCGQFDPKKHDSYVDCAKQELSEEARLKGGRFVRLLNANHPGIPEAKWCRNRFVPFLVIDPEEDKNPSPRDAEEFIKIKRVPVKHLKELFITKQVLTPTMVTAYLALDRLTDMGYI